MVLKNASVVFIFIFILTLFPPHIKIYSIIGNIKLPLLNDKKVFILKINETSRTYSNFSILKSIIKFNERTVIKHLNYIVDIIDQFTNHVRTLIVKVNRYDLEREDNKLVVIDRISLFTFSHLAH